MTIGLVVAEFRGSELVIIGPYFGIELAKKESQKRDEREQQRNGTKIRRWNSKNPQRNGNITYRIKVKNEEKEQQKSTKSTYLFVIVTGSTTINFLTLEFGCCLELTRGELIL